jgi:hypothetical protein
VVSYIYIYVCVCVPSFMKIGSGVQAILRFRLINLRGCNVGNTDEMGSAATKYILSFIKIGLGIQTLLRGINSRHAGSKMIS